jgi:hypothetical protein
VNTIDWRRIQSLNLYPVAWRVARTYDADVGDVLGDMVLAIAERARSDLTFLEQTDAYIRQWSKWRATDRFYRPSPATAPLDDERVASKESEPQAARPCLADVEIALMALPGDLRDVAAVLLSDPGRFLAGGHRGNVNKAALGREFGRSAWWARERLGRLQCALASINGVSTV